MTWYSVYEQATGRLISSGSSVGQDLPQGLVVLEQAEKPDPDKTRWDETAKDYVPFVPPRRLFTGDFWDLFTDTEMANVMNYQVGFAFQANKRFMAVFMERVRYRQMVDMNDVRMDQFFSVLQAEGVLTAERTTQIRQ